MARKRVSIFGVLWTFDAIVAAVFVYFFFSGLAHGSVSSFNIRSWFGILGGFAAILAGSRMLRRAGLQPLGVALLAFPAVPAFGYLIFLLAAIVLHPRWN